MLHIDGKEFVVQGFNLDGFTNKDDLVKSHIQHAFPSYGDSKISFKKTGAEIKGFLGLKRSDMDGKKMLCESKATNLLSTLKESGHEPSEPEGMYSEGSDTYFTFGYKEREEASGDSKKYMGMYNAIAYKIQNYERDLKFVDTMIENLEDKKSYNLSPQQLTTLSKAEMGDTIEKSQSGETIKVGSVMGEFKEGKLMSNSGKRVTNRAQAISIAMDGAGISKGCTCDEVKKYFAPEYHIDLEKAEEYGAKADESTNSKEYKQHFAMMLKKAGYKSINDVKDKEKFFEDVDSSWKAKSEKVSKAIGDAFSELGIDVEKDI